MLKQLMGKMHHHAQKLGMSPPSSCTNKKTITAFLACSTSMDWKTYQWKHEKKSTLVTLCQQQVQGFKKTDARKTKDYLIDLLMATLNPESATKKESVEKIPIPETTVVEKKTKHPLERLSKTDLLRACQTHTSFQRSMEKWKKEKLVEFVLEKEIHVSPPSKPWKKMTKQELFDVCMTKTGFDAKSHGKTKQTLLAFLENTACHPPAPQEETTGSVNDETGCSPINVNLLLEHPEDPELLKKKILHVLMNSSPFQDDPQLDKKVSKLL